MAHFSKTAHKFMNGLDGNKEYRITAWINAKTPWNDTTGKYDFMSDEQKQQCEELFRQFQSGDFQISITLSERTDAVDQFGKPDVRSFPKAGSVTLYTNKFNNSSHISEKITVDTSTPPTASSKDNEDYQGFA